MWRIPTGLRWSAVSLLLAFIACSSSKPQENVSSTTQAVSNTARVLSFEQPTTDWTPSGLSLQQGNQFVDGQHSAAVTVTNNGGQLISVPLSSLGPISSTVTLQVRLPSYVASTSWEGQFALRLNSPQAGVFSQYEGAVAFSNSPTGVFHQIQFTLPPAIQNALSTKVYSDFVISVELDFQPNPNPAVGFADAFYIDKLDFGQAAQADGGAGGGGVSGAGGSTLTGTGTGTGTGAGASGGTGGSTGTGAAGGSTGTGTGATANGGGGTSAGSGGSGNATSGSGAGAGGASGGSTSTSGPCAFSAPPSAAGATSVDFTIKLPHGVNREDLGIATTGGYLTLDDGVRVVNDAGGLASVSSVSATNRTNLGVAAQVQDVYTESTGIDLRSNAHVHGNLKTAADLTEQAGAVVDGAVSQNTSLQPLDTIDWSVPFPRVNRGSCSIEPDNTEIIDPGSYGDIAVKSRSHLKIRSGTYYFNSLSFEPQAEIDIDNTAGPVFIYVLTSFAFSGTVVEADTARMNFLFGVAGTGNVNIQSAFRGILVAPSAGVSLPTQSGVGHVGAFFANALIAHQSTDIHQRAFSPALFCDPGAACSSFCPCTTGKACVSADQCVTGLGCNAGSCQCVPQCANKHCGDDLSDGCGGFCPGLCTPGQPGCTASVDCAQGTVCGIRVGARFGLDPAANVCWDPACAHQDPSQPNCGVGSAQCGACPVCTPQCAGGGTGPDGCGGFCGACTNGLVRLPNGLCGNPQVFSDALTPNFPIPLFSGPTDAVGALPGVFKVTDQGTASYSIPIDVPPGRLGLQPTLSLDYLSTKANGMVGIGWRLGGLSTISRCPSIQARDGVTRPVLFTAQDRFCLDGQELTAVAAGPPVAGDFTAEYRTEIDSFRRIRSFGDNFASDGTYVGPTSFLVHTKDGHVLTYGATVDSRIAVGAVTWKWALTRIADRSGNSISISYKSHVTMGNISLSFPGFSGPFGSSSAPVDIDLGSFAQETGELVPDTVSYNGDPGAPGGTFVNFVYEDRPDQLQHYTAGAVGYSTQRLTNIKTNVGTSVVLDYHLAYEPNRADHQSRLVSITKCAAESGSEVCQQPTLLTYGEAVPSSEPEQQSPVLPSPGGATNSLFSLDVNGDGLDDLAAVSDDRVGIALSDGTGNFGTFVQTPFFTGGSSQCVSAASVLDVNRDGKDDLIDLCPGANPALGARNAIAHISNGDGTFTDQTLPFTFGGRLKLGDIDGDGLKDFVACDDFDSVFGVVLSTGTNVNGVPGTRATDVNSAPKHGNCDTIRIFDIDGDGDDDIVQFVEPESEVGPNGTQRVLVFDWPSRSWRDYGPSPGQAIKDATAMLDVNGDGLEDIVTDDGSDGQHVRLWLNTGVGFTPTTSFVANPNPTFFGQITGVPLDYDGDGVQDLLVNKNVLKWTSPTSVQVIPVAQFTLPGNSFTAMDVNGDGDLEFVKYSTADNLARVDFLTSGARAGLLQTVTDGFGKRTSINYDPNFDLPENGITGPNVSTYTAGSSDATSSSLRRVTPLVSHYAESQVSGTQVKPGRDFFCQYTDARLGLGGRGWFGFGNRTIEAVDPVESTLTTLSYHNTDFLFAGRLTQSKVEWLGSVPATPASAAESNRVQLDNYSWSAHSGDFVQFPFVETEDHSFTEGGDSSLTDTSGSRQVDIYGNATKESFFSNVQAAVVDDSTIVRTFDIDAGQWLIGRLSTEGSTDSRQGRSVLRTKHFTYAPGTLLVATAERQPDPSSFSGPNPASPTEYRLTTITREANGSGNVQTTCQSDSRGTQFRRCSKVTGFDEQDIFPTGIQDAVGLATQTRYSSINGQLWWSKDPNGLVTEYGYDAFGRVQAVKSPTSDGVIEYSRPTPASQVGLTSWSAYGITESFTGRGAVSHHFDAFGHLVRTLKTPLNNVFFQLIDSEREYDAAGRLTRISAPHLLDDASQGVTQLAYDAYGRLISEQAADSTVTNYYPVNADTAVGVLSSWFDATATGERAAAGVVVQKPRQNAEATIRDFAGNTLRSIQSPAVTTAGEAETSYSYGPFDMPLEVDAPIGQTSIVPDNLGRSLQVTDPAVGLQVRAYDGFDEQLQSTDGNGKLTQNIFDADGRQTELRDGAGALIAKWVFDGPNANEKGRLTGAYREATPQAASGNWTRYHYQTGDRGLLQSISYGIGGIPDDMDSGEQHALGLDYKTTVPWQVDVIEYPNDGGPFNVAYDYDSTGAVNKVYPAGDSAHPYWQLKDTDQGFRPKTEAFGNGLVTTRDYYSLTNGTEECETFPSHSCLPGRLRGILTENGAAASTSTVFPVQDTQYAYDGNGNLASFVPGVGAPIAELYGYDGFDRLTNHIEQIPTAPGTIPVETYSYDLMGNITSNNANCANDNANCYKYNKAGHPFQVTSMPGAAYGYDDAGNQTTRTGTSIPGGSQTLEYNDFNMPWRITTGTGNANQVEFEYDAFGSRLIKRKVSGGNVSEVTLDIAELYEQVDQPFAGQRTHQYRIYANRQVAQVTRVQLGSIIDTSHDKTVYLHDDIVGSASVITDSEGGLVEQRKFSSFGDDGGAVDYLTTGVLSGFTGAEQDVDLGLTNMRGRLYDPKLGRFITPDPFVARPYNAQGLNRYAYVENNPLKFVDPTGFDGAPPDTGATQGPINWQAINQNNASIEGEEAGQAGSESTAAGAAYGASLTESQQSAAGAAAEAAGSPGSPGAGGRASAASTTADPTTAPGGQNGSWPAGNLGSPSSAVPASQAYQPVSGFNHWLLYGNYWGSSVIQSDKALTNLQNYALGISAGALVVAGGGVVLAEGLEVAAAGEGGGVGLTTAGSAIVGAGTSAIGELGGEAIESGGKKGPDVGKVGTAAAVGGVAGGVGGLFSWFGASSAVVLGGKLTALDKGVALGLTTGVSAGLGSWGALLTHSSPVAGGLAGAVTGAANPSSGPATGVGLGIVITGAF